MTKLATLNKVRGWPFAPIRFDSVFFPPLSSFFDEVSYSPTRYNEKDNTLTVDLPGFKQSDILAEINGGYLIIKAKNEKSSYYQSFSLGYDFDVDKVEAKLENGQLKVSLPMSSENKTRKIEIKS